ncbi:MAG: nucleotidyltransferase family protein [bacterium]
MGTSEKQSRFDVSEAALAQFCRDHHVRRLALFGSVLREDFGTGSDIDVLVEFDPDARVGLFEMARMERELSRIAGRKVDLRTPAELSRYFRDDVLAKAEVRYSAG